MSKKVLLINCAYRQGSITDKMVNEVSKHLEKNGCTCTMLNLREHEFSDCIKCRVCAQKCKDSPGECVNKDKMNEIVKMIEESNGYVIASPARFYLTSRFFKCFLGRLSVYFYWPYGQKEPQPIKKVLQKKAVLISVFPIPEILAKIYSKTINQLKKCARLIGAKVVDVIYIGMSPIKMSRELSTQEKNQARKASEKLLRELY